MAESKGTFAELSRQSSNSLFACSIVAATVGIFVWLFFSEKIENQRNCISYQHIDGAVSDKCFLQFGKVLITVVAC